MKALAALFRWHAFAKGWELIFTTWQSFYAQLKPRPGRHVDNQRVIKIKKKYYVNNENFNPTKRQIFEISK